MSAPIWVAPVTILLAFPTAAQTPPASPTADPLEWKGQYGGDAEGAELILDAAHWNSLWRSLERPAPTLDFTKFFAVVAYAGERPTGGFTLEFLEPAPQGDDLLIRWRVRSPSPDSYTTQAIAHPWKVKAFPRPKGTVRLEQGATGIPPHG